MLSRVADSICWMSRYVERAENVARFIDVKLQFMPDPAFTSVDEVIDSGLQEYLDNLQTRMNRVGGGIYEAFLH